MEFLLAQFGSWLKMMDGQRIKKERRQHARFDFCDKLFFQITVPTDQWPPPSGESVQMEQKPSADIKNVGSRGCCLKVDHPLEKFQIIKMDFPLSKVRLSVPTLAEIRWVYRDPQLNQYTVGLRYLL